MELFKTPYQLSHKTLAKTKNISILKLIARKANTGDAMKLLCRIILTTLICSSAYTSELLQGLATITTESTPIEYIPQVLNSLESSIIRKLITQLLEDSPEAVRLLQSREIAILREALKATLLNDYRVLFLDIFKGLLTPTKVPLDKVVAGGFCADPDHVVLLNQSTITLWSVRELLSEQPACLDSKPLTITRLSTAVSPSFLKTSRANRFIIHDRYQRKVLIWHICYKGNPTLVRERSVKLFSHDEVTLSSDGCLLSISERYPVVTWLKKPKHRKRLKPSAEELLEDEFLQTYQSAACMSGNGCYLATQSIDDSIACWDIKSDKPIPCTEVSGQAVEALDATGKYLITSKKASGSYLLWNRANNTTDLLYKKEGSSNPFTLHEPVSISADGRFATLSLANQDPVLFDLVHRMGIPLPLAEEPLKDNEINFIQLNSTNTFLLYIKNNKAYVVDLVTPMNNLSLEALILIIKLQQHGTKLLQQPFYAKILTGLPKNIQVLLNAYFNTKG